MRVKRVVPLLPDENTAASSLSHLEFLDSLVQDVNQDMREPEFEKSNTFNGSAESLVRRAILLRDVQAQKRTLHFGLYVPCNSIAERPEDCSSATDYHWLRHYQRLPLPSIKRPEMFIHFTESEALYGLYQSSVKYSKVGFFQTDDTQHLAESIRTQPKKLTLRQTRPAQPPSAPSAPSSPDAHNEHEADQVNISGLRLCLRVYGCACVYWWFTPCVFLSLDDNCPLTMP